MDYTLWDAVTYYVPGISNKEDLVNLILRLVKADSDKEGKEFVEKTLYPIFNCENLSACDIAYTAFDIPRHFPSFNSKDISAVFSSSILTDFFAPNDSRRLDTDDIIMDFLYPNLFGIFALVAIGQKEPPENFRTLADLKENYSINKDIDTGLKIKPASLPDELRNLFAIERKSENSNSPYKIGTKFPDLLYAILKNVNISPLSKIKKTSNSLVYSKEFYDNCIQGIDRDKQRLEYRFAKFYLFERIFRLHTKFSLVFYENYPEANPVLSPKFLRDFFFHSPLVIFPGATLRSLYIGAKETLHFLMQLSAHWFPCILLILRCYAESQRITTLDDICKFFFPAPVEALCFQEYFRSPLKGNPSYKEFFPEDTERAKRKLRDTFSGRWEDFQPDPTYSAESYTPQLLDDVASMLYQGYSDLSDSEAAKSILLTLS